MSTPRAGRQPDHTTEDDWRQWTGWGGIREVSLTGVSRVVVASAHPDDDVLGVGMLTQGLREHGVDVTVVIATDGEGSHPDSPTHPPAELARLRRAETQEALRRSGLADVPVRRLGLPDSGLTRRASPLRSRLAPLVGDVDVVIAPWRGDGHPDHEELGRACVDVGAELATPVWEYPVWAWHWAEPDGTDLPWDRARRWFGSAEQQERKQHALTAFRTQLHPLSSAAADRAVLPEDVLAHFRRPFEVVFT